jgi:hypothetical protein
MKRVKAGMYVQGDYYTYKMEDNGLWTVGITGEDGNTWIDDFKSYRSARGFILRQVEKVSN